MPSIDHTTHLLFLHSSLLLLPETLLFTKRHEATMLLLTAIWQLFVARHGHLRGAIDSRIIYERMFQIGKDIQSQPSELTRPIKYQLHYRVPGASA